MILRLILLWMIVISSSHLLMSQDMPTNLYQAIIVDLDTQTPVANAHVIVANSTVSTHADNLGKFELLYSAVAGRDIIISHVGYTLMDYTIPLEQTNEDTIWLKPKSEVINVMIKTERTDIKKKRLKIFKKDLFGTHARAKKMSLLNPEAILFEERGDSLIAYATDLLKIKNEFLGYDVYFYLKEYMHTDEITTYNGKAFFKELDMNQRQKNKFAKKEKRICAVAEKHFLKALFKFKQANQHLAQAIMVKNLHLL